MTDTSQNSTTPAVKATYRPPTVGLCVAAIASGASGAFVGTLLTGMLGWPEAPSAFKGAAIGGGVVAVVGLFVAVFVHLLLGRATGQQATFAANQAVLAAPAIRLLGVLFLGLFASLLTDLDRPMWLGLLAAGLLSLVVDTLLMTRALGRSNGAH